jgi:hypothetical protein
VPASHAEPHGPKGNPAIRELLQFPVIDVFSACGTSIIQEIRMNLRISERTEGSLTSDIEHQTAKLPSISYLGLALASMSASAVLKIMGRDSWALFVGQWAAPFLIIGTYNKLVKQHGSDQAESEFEQAA